jgi:hypothetical protein
VEQRLRTDVEELKAGWTAGASARLGHDVSQIPIHPPAAGAIQTKHPAISGGPKTNPRTKNKYRRIYVSMNQSMTQKRDVSFPADN